MRFLTGFIAGGIIVGITTWGVTLGARLDHASDVDAEYVDYCTSLEADAANIALTSLRVMATTERYVEKLVGATDG